MRARIARMAAWGCAAGMVAGMAACSGQTQMRGRAITGSAGIVTVVADDRTHDDRPGVEGVEVTMRTAGGGLIGTTTSRADGRFNLRVPSERAHGQIEVIAEREGYPRQRGTVTFPGSRHLLLVILPDRGGSGDGGGSGGGGTDAGPGR